MYIESIHNPHVKEWVKLKEKKYRDEQNLFLVEGEHLILEAKKKNCIKEIISSDQNLEADFYVPEMIMKKISSQVTPVARIAVCYKLEEKELKKKVLVLDGIQDPGNLGTMIRSAVAFCFDSIIISMDTVDVYNEKVIRSSQGMIFHINILRRNLLDFMQENKEKYSILITDVRIGENIRDIKNKEPFMLVIGNEGNGVTKEIQDFHTHFVKLKMNRACESLNAAVAASILMYELSEDIYE